MVRLPISSAPAWIDFGPDVRVLLRPMSSAIYQAAVSDPAVQDALQLREPFEFAAAVAKAVMRRAVVEWQGVGDMDGNPVPPEAAWVSALLDHRVYRDAFDDLYLGPWLMVGDEKKGLSPVPDGTSGGALSIAGTAEAPAPLAPTDATSP